MKRNLLTRVRQMFGMHSEKESDVKIQDKSNSNPGDDSKEPDFFDTMSRKSFYRAEAAYRHQRIVLPCYNSETGIPLKDILTKLFPELIPQVSNMTVLKTVQISGVETEWKHYDNLDEALAYDLFWNINYKNDDGEIYPLTGTNITIVIRTTGVGVPRYVVLFVRGTVIGFERTYIRLSLIVPSNAAEDDLRTSKSNSVPTVTSLLIACDKKKDSVHFTEYEAAEHRVKSCIDNGVRLRDDIDAELYFGLGEFHPTSHYIGYGKWLLENNRYYDAFAQFMRAINAMRRHPNEDLEDFYEVCKLIAGCLTKLNSPEMTGYFYSLAYTGGKVSGEELANYWASIGDCRALPFTHRELAAKYGEDHESWPQYAKDKELEILLSYKKVCNDNKERMNTASFYSDISIGVILNRLLNINYNNISGLAVIASNGEIKSIEDKNQAWSESIYKYLEPGTTIVLPYSRAYYETEEKEDKSVLCHASSIVIRIDDANKDEKLVRVTIMVPNFNNDDDKHDISEMNNPISISFIMSSVENPVLSGEKDVDKIFDYGQMCDSQNRYFEAQIAYLYVFKLLSADYLTLDDESKTVFYGAAYRLGFCFEELQKHEHALFYLQTASYSWLNTHVQEYINALSNVKDPRALEVIREAKRTPFNADPDSREYKFHFAFLNRREAFVLIDQGKYDEAESLLKEMLKEPACKDFAQGELNYIAQLRGQ